MIEVSLLWASMLQVQENCKKISSDHKLQANACPQTGKSFSRWSEYLISTPYRLKVFHPKIMRTSLATVKLNTKLYNEDQATNFRHSSIFRIPYLRSSIPTWTATVEEHPGSYFVSVPSWNESEADCQNQECWFRVLTGRVLIRWDLRTIPPSAKLENRSLEPVWSKSAVPRPA
jgi:hypothetical protein